MRGIFTREERVVVLFLAVSLLVGSAVVRAGRMFPSAIPDFGGVSGQHGEASAVDPLPVWPVDVNTAGVDDLVRLPGIGPVRASEIVRRRELTGGYSTLEELLEIKGIGPVTLDGLRDKATVGGGVALPAD
jgi:competence ComEA-like helix-hairpin-helix protein